MHRKVSVGIIFFTVFMDLLGFGMVLPLMPLYAADPRFQASAIEIGWLMAVYSIMQFLFAPLWGHLSDRIGRRPVLIIGLFGSALSYLVYGLAQSLLVLFVARSIAGIMGANIAVAQAAMADVTTSEGRTKAMGLIGVAFGLGFVLGPALGGLASGYGLAMAPLLAAGITGLNALVALFLLGESRPAGQQETTSRPTHPLLGASWERAQSLPAALQLCLLMGLYTTLFAAFEVTMPLWGEATLGWTVRSIGWVFTYVGVIAVVVQGGVVRRLASRLGEKWTAAMGLGLVAVGMALFALDGLAVALAALALIAAGSGLVHPSLSSLVSLNSSAEQQGFVLGMFQSMSALGRGVGPVLGGLGYATWTGTTFLLIAAGLGLTWLAFRRAGQQVRDTRQGVSDFPIGKPNASPTVP
ncbi:MAG: MFS transporter [Magnetococcales bacterium]|nr:MFS transporter [Magnetococcales bacterium]